MGLADISGICSHNMRRTTERNLFTDGLQSSSIRALTFLPPPLLLLLITLLAMGRGGTLDCGGYVQVGDKPRTIKSGIYDGYIRCIWLLEAPASHQVNVRIYLNHSTKESSCQSLEIRDWGGGSNLIHSTDCASVKGVTFQSHNRWIYIKLTNHDQSAMNAVSMTCSAMYNRTVQKIIDPLVCSSYEFVCPNKLCLEFSFHCDGFNDCGYLGEGNDEYGCFDLHLGGFYMLLSGILAGFVLMIIVMVSGYFLNKHHNWENVASALENWRYTEEKKPTRKVAVVMPAEHKPFTSVVSTPRISMSPALLDVHGPKSISVRTAATLTRSLLSVRSRSFQESRSSLDATQSSSQSKD